MLTMIYSRFHKDQWLLFQPSNLSTSATETLRPPSVGPQSTTATYRDQHTSTSSPSFGTQHPEKSLPVAHQAPPPESRQVGLVQTAMSRAVGRQPSSRGPPSGLQPAYPSLPGPPQPPGSRGSADSLLSEAEVPPPSPGPSYLSCPRG